MAFIEAYVTNLGKYNEGELASEPLKFPTTTEEVQALLKRIGVDNIQYQQQINGESTEIEIDLIDWCSDMLYKEGYEDIELMTEALYHINCDYLLSDYLQWPMYDTKRENPFRPYFELWKMGLNIYFPERGRVVLIG